MTWLPGWDSIENTKFWETFHFWAGIVALILTAIFAVATHVYTSRKDELVSNAQRETSDQAMRAQEFVNTRHAGEVDAMKKQLANAENIAVDAKLKAAEVHSLQQQRQLSDTQKDKLIAVLSPFRGQRVTITTVMGDGDGDIFAKDFVSVLESAGWNHDGGNGISQSIIMPTPNGIQVGMNDEEAKAGRVLKSVEVFVIALHEIGITNSNTVFVNSSIPIGSVALIIGNRPRPE